MEDVEDQPPEWVTVAPVTRIPEDVALFSPVSIFIIIMAIIRDDNDHDGSHKGWERNDPVFLLYLSLDHIQKTPYTQKSIFSKKRFDRIGG